MLTSGTPQETVQAARAFVAHDDPEVAASAVNALIGVLRGADSASKMEAVRTLGYFGTRAHAAVPILKQIRQQASRPVTWEDFAEQVSMAQSRGDRKVLLAPLEERIRREEPVQPELVKAVETALSSIEKNPAPEA